MIAAGAVLGLLGVWIFLFNTRQRLVPWLLGTGLALLLIGQALAQHSGHPPQDQAIHDRFYSTWMRPSDRQHSCCSSIDCYPTQARMTSGGWTALRREDQKWISVPDGAVDLERTSPDGRNHLCAAPPNRTSSDTVYCFVPGGGT